MLNKKIEDAFNEQITAEFYSAYLYLSMASYFEKINLPGFANWMRIQFQEEQFHAMKIFNYTVERGATVELKAIPQPPNEWDSPLAVFEATLAHEVSVTKMINDLIYLARDERDNAAEVFLQWFINEQVEEESTAENIIGNLKLAKDSSQTLFMLDRELGARVFTPPVTK
jgi:ferritin